MPGSFKLLFDGAPATQEQLDLFRRVSVAQGIGLVTEAELEIAMLLDETGRWVDLDEAFAEPFSRIRVEVQASEDADFVALIDGPVVAQRMTMSAEPDDSVLTIVVNDDSVLLNQNDAVSVFEELAASDIAEILFAEAGLTPQVDATGDGGNLERAVVQRGTAAQLLRDLARANGMAMRVEPGPVPGASLGIFGKLALDGEDLPELLLTGGSRNLASVEIEFDGLRPFATAAASIDASSLEVLRAEAETSSQTTLGDESAHAIVKPARVLMARTRETTGDLDAAVAAAADAASWAFTATGEVDGEAYGAVLRPYATVALAGAGPMSGRYLVAQVHHVIDDNEHRQEFVLRRNARSVLGAAAGGLGGGVF